MDRICEPKECMFGDHYDGCVIRNYFSDKGS